jgi:hypothetical protein
MPEPFLGDLTGSVAGVFLALNPGRSVPTFQGRQGVFASEILEHGSYSAWAATWPYLRGPWSTTVGPNRHHESRLTFLRRWTHSPDLPAAEMVGFELYPWHSTAVTGAMRPPSEFIERWVWQPLREIGALVFAFGAPWFPLLESGLGLQVVDRLGVGGRPYGSAVPSRAVLVLKDHSGMTVIAERHSGSAGPPSSTETDLLQDALAEWLP